MRSDFSPLNLRPKANRPEDGFSNTAREKRLNFGESLAHSEREMGIEFRGKPGAKLNTLSFQPA
jgi:hypothetical protein